MERNKKMQGETERKCKKWEEKTKEKSKEKQKQTKGNKNKCTRP